MKLSDIFHKCAKHLLFPAMLMVATSAHAVVVVIVSAQSHITSLTADQAKRIFLGKTNRFPNDDTAAPIDQTEGNAARDEFYSQIVHKSPSQLSAYWAKVIFTGDGRPPEKLESDAAVIKAVASSPNAIGYVNKSAVDSSVRVVLEPKAELPKK